jgi:hypothetical protein
MSFESMLDAIVAQPLAPPSPLEHIQERARRVRRKRRMTVVATALGAFAVVTGLVVVPGDQPSTVTVAADGPRRGEFVATEPGGYQALGRWKLTVIRGGETFRYSSEAGPRCLDDAVRPGDVVTAEILDGDSWLKVGEGAACPAD